MPEVIRINMKDPLYQKERLLRNRVLLRPIGIPDFGWEMNDPRAWHFVAIESGHLIGCVLLVPMDDMNTKAQLTQMAVDDSCQKTGVGRLLVQELIDFAKSEGIREIEIHSRSTVTQFYERFGFEVFGPEFEEVGISHRYMSKRL